MTQELVPLLGELDAAGVALEEADAEVDLKLLDGLGDGRLGDRDRLGGGGHGPLLGNGHEVPDLTQGNRHGFGRAFFRLTLETPVSAAGPSITEPDP